MKRRRVHDTFAIRCTDESPGSHVSWFLMASYLYYCEDESLISDELYDHLVEWIEAHYDSIQHPHKYLISRDMFSIGSAYGLKEEDYPLRVKCAARQLLRQL